MWARPRPVRLRKRTPGSGARTSTTYVDPDVRGSSIVRRLLDASTGLALAFDRDVMVVDT